MTVQTDAVERRDTLFVGGEWVEPHGTEIVSVVNPTTEEPIALVRAGSAQDVDRAVAAAREAFGTWSTTTPEERARWMQRIADGIADRADDFAEVISRELGSPLGQSHSIHVKMGVNDFALMPDAIAEIAWQERLRNSVIHRVPVGVIGAITPWNYPLHQITTKVAGALSAGCTVVLKPALATPLTAYLFAELLHDIDLPAGVFNLVPGTGRIVGEALVRHPDVDMISFTGSTQAGARISQLAAEQVKPVAMELGGKSAAVILAGADLRTAVETTLTKTYQNAGQSCSAPTRLLVPRGLMDEVAALAAQASAPYSPDSDAEFPGKMGPVISGDQLDSIRGYIQQGIDEGARLVHGGLSRPTVSEQGYYVEPTVFADVSNDMTIAREEIFGPVLSIIPFDSEDDAVRIANESEYGLSGAVWAADAEDAARVALRLRTGQVSINGGPFNPGAPFGGFKRSGHGRENGRFGIEEYLTYISLQY